MNMHVKAGHPSDVHSSIPPRGGRRQVRDYSGNPGVSGQPYPSDRFMDAMEEGFSAEETNQGGFSNTPAENGTFQARFLELVKQIRLTLVYAFLPEDYEVVHKQPLKQMRDFLTLARELWNEYEPLLGRRNTPVAAHQIDNPFDEDEEEFNVR